MSTPWARDTDGAAARHATDARNIAKRLVISPPGGPSAALPAIYECWFRGGSQQGSPPRSIPNRGRGRGLASDRDRELASPNLDRMAADAHVHDVVTAAGCAHEEPARPP